MKNEWTPSKNMDLEQLRFLKMKNRQRQKIHSENVLKINMIIANKIYEERQENAKCTTQIN